VQARRRAGAAPGRACRQSSGSDYQRKPKVSDTHEGGSGALRPGRLLVLYAAVLVDAIGLGIILPLLPFYAELMGATPVQVTLLVASFSAMQVAAAPIWGRISDRRGRRPLLVLALYASALAHLIWGLAGSLAVLFASRLAAGAAGGTITLAQAYVTDATESHQRTQALGWIGAAAGLGIMIGPAIGALFSRYGLGVPGFVAAGLCALNATVALIVLPAPSRRAPSGAAGRTATLRGWLGAMTERPLSRLLSIYFLSIASFTGMLAVLALYLERSFGIGASQMGWVMSFGGGMTVLVRGVLLGPLVQSLGESRTVRVGALALAASLALVPLLPGVVWVVLPVALYAVGAGTLFPSLASLVAGAADGTSVGAILGGSQVVGGIGRVLGPMLAGTLFQHVGIASPFAAGALLVSCAWLLSLGISGQDLALRPAGQPRGQASGDGVSPAGQAQSEPGINR
jgi:MFS family permease